MQMIYLVIVESEALNVVILFMAHIMNDKSVTNSNYML